MRDDLLGVPSARANLDAMEAAKYEYIVGMKMRNIVEVRDCAPVACGTNCTAGNCFAIDGQYRQTWTYRIYVR